MVALGLTYVEHDGTLAQHLLAIVSLAPVLLIAAYFTALFLRRDVHTACVLAGQALCQALNSVLKRAIAQPRPAGATGLGKHGEDFGMPSAHAQFAGFFAGYYLLLALQRRGAAAERGVFAAALLACGVLVPYSRVELGYHTAEQAVAGTLVGAGFAAVWRLATVRLFAPRLFPAVQELRVAKALCVYDDSDIPDFFAWQFQRVLQHQEATRYTSASKTR